MIGPFLVFGSQLQVFARSLALAVGAEIVGLLGGLLGDVVGGAEVEAGVLRIAVELDLVDQRLEPVRELDEGAAGDLVDGHLPFFLGKDVPLLPDPVDEHAARRSAAMGPPVSKIVLLCAECVPLVQCQMSASLPS